MGLDAIKLMAAPYMAYLKVAALAGLFALGAWSGWALKNLSCTAAMSLHEAADAVKDAEANRKLAEATQAVMDSERRHAADLAAIAEAHEEDKRNAEAAYERDVADLRAGNVRLQNRWRGCVATSEAIASGAAEPDAAARDREESAARIVRAARDADDWIKRLQDVIRSDRE